MHKSGGRALMMLTLWFSGAAMAMVCAGLTMPAQASGEAFGVELPSLSNAYIQPTDFSRSRNCNLTIEVSVCTGAAVSSATITDETEPVPDAGILKKNAPDPCDGKYIIPLSDDDLELLARVISAEARGESYDGQVAVGAVILNRVESDSFPDSVSAVCSEPGAFCGVANGQVNIEPDQSCRQAAVAAAMGADPTGGAVFFYNPKTAANDWIRSRPVVKTIGNHCFCV